MSKKDDDDKKEKGPPLDLLAENKILSFTINVREGEIEQLKNRAEFLIKEIGDYKKEIKKKYLNNNELKSKFKKMDTKPSIDRPTDSNFK